MTTDRLAASKARTSAGRLADTALDRSVVGGYTRWGLRLRRRLPHWPADPAPDALAGAVALVTGASSGLGQSTAEGLARLGARVHLVVRDLDKGERTRDLLTRTVPGAEVRLWRCDVSDLDDVRRLAGDLAETEDRLDVIVHNAGALPASRTTTPQGHELTMALHVLGPLRLTEDLRGLLHAAGSSRVIWITSGGMYSQSLPDDDPEYRHGTYKGAVAYARSKRTQVALLGVLRHRWAADGIDVHAMHPGWVDTPGVASSLPGFHRLTGRALRDVDEGADTTVWLAAAMPPPPSGRLWHDRRPRPTHLLPWTRETVDQRRSMWDWCARAVGVEP